MKANWCDQICIKLRSEIKIKMEPFALNGIRVTFYYQSLSIFEVFQMGLIRGIKCLFFYRL